MQPPNQQSERDRKRNTCRREHRNFVRNSNRTHELLARPCESRSEATSRIALRMSCRS